MLNVRTMKSKKMLSLNEYATAQNCLDALIDECYGLRGMARPVFTFADRLLFLGNKIIRWAIKVPQRISRWPYKIRIKLSKKAK